MLKNKGQLKKKPLKKPPSSKIRKRTPALKKRKVRFGTDATAPPVAATGATTVSAPGAETKTAAPPVDETKTAAKQAEPPFSIFLTFLAVVSLIFHAFVVFDVPAYKIGLWAVLFCVHVALAYLFFSFEFTTKWRRRALMIAWLTGSLLTIVAPFLYPFFEKEEDADDSE